VTVTETHVKLYVNDSKKDNTSHLAMYSWFFYLYCVQLIMPSETSKCYSFNNAINTLMAALEQKIYRMFN
jgi:hypothetical protein